MSYRPITDFWFLTRAKLKDGKKYYGAYLGGFPERARRLIGVSIKKPILHVCGGMAKQYPYAGGFGKLDSTLDIDPKCEPDFIADARESFPLMTGGHEWYGILIDPPYSEQEAQNYECGSSVYPNPDILVKNGINAVELGGKVGIIHYVLPRCPKNAKFIAAVGIICGFGNRIRCYSVFERTN